MSHLLIATAPSQGAALFQSLVPMILIFVVFYFILFRPMSQKQKALAAMREALEKGDKVITNGGLYGEVAKVEGHKVVLKLSDNVKVRIARDFIAGLESQQEREGNRS